jgi:alginate O-acetyltransferase complex protein AlgI
MHFNSGHFLLFFPVVAGLYFLLPHRFRWMLLLTASYFFYMCAVPGYAVLLLASTVVDYCAGLAMAGCVDRRYRVALLTTSLVTNLGLLFAFKYFNFFADSLQSLAGAMGTDVSVPLSQLVLPVGISFYTFQTLSYSIDVFRGRQAPERHFGRFALFVSFFPQLVAGPIERSTNLLPQFTREVSFDYARVTAGLRLMAWGMFKKVVIADHLAVLVNTVYGDPTNLVGPHFVIATLFFAFQIYCDFSGYTDIAIGAAEVLGIRLMTNFNRPYQARSISDFWSRWHISLSSWFRDYLYIPLGGNRVAVPRWYLNLIVVFVISGLWHGANWTFVIWGLLHGSFLVVGLLTRSAREHATRVLALDRLPRLHAALQRVGVFGLVCFAWIFFRADSLGDAWHIVTHLHTGWSGLFDVHTLRLMRDQIGVQEPYLIQAALLILTLEIFQGINPSELWHRLTERRPWPVRWAFYVALLLALINLGAGRPESFIYFQF